MSGFLDGKTIVIMGVANRRSIAWGCTQAILDQGAKVILTYQNDRIKRVWNALFRMIWILLNVMFQTMQT